MQELEHSNCVLQTHIKELEEWHKEKDTVIEQLTAKLKEMAAMQKNLNEDRLRRDQDYLVMAEKHKQANKDFEAFFKTSAGGSD